MIWVNAGINNPDDDTRSIQMRIGAKLRNVYTRQSYLEPLLQVTRRNDSIDLRIV